MEDNLRSISTDLFYKVRSRFSGLKLGEESGEVTINPEDAVFFDFDYMEGENPIGHVSISLAEPSSMKVYYSTGITEDMDGVQKDGWYQFLKSMRAFAKRRLMSFDARDITKDNLDKRDYAFLSQYSKNSQVGESVMSEGMYGTNKTSYQKLENTKQLTKLAQALEQEILQHCLLKIQQAKDLNIRSFTCRVLEQCKDMFKKAAFHMTILENIL